MSRERPETWEEVVDNRDYYNGNVIRNALHIRAIYRHFISPPNLLLVPTRAEWEAAQQLNAELLAMLERLEFAYFDTECFCPICHGQNEHYIECDLAALLKKARGE